MSKEERCSSCAPLSQLKQQQALTTRRKSAMLLGCLKRLSSDLFDFGDDVLAIRALAQIGTLFANRKEKQQKDRTKKAFSMRQIGSRGEK